jgi:lysine-specific demethylase 8
MDKDDWMSQVVKVLDLGLVVSGGTMRGEVYEAIFANLEPFIGQDDISGDISRVFDIDQPEPLATNRPVTIVSQPSLEDFQIHLNNDTTPLLLLDTINDWPAIKTWRDPLYLLRLTLGGRRCVPIEIGETYTHADWRQEIMSLRRFLHEHILPVDPKEIGYLGQHNLFHQIPQLQQDIRTPDYCYTAPPEATPASRLGLPAVPPVDEPQKNIWLGPKGTRTPLHTDPYHNIFCQVVGYKYVRLYAPSATESLYPRGEDENGINESNTSEVEIRLDRTQQSNVAVEDAESFPLFLSQGNYYEAIVGPGECLYIPAGWWHYIESLTVSYSVSFWWN